MSPASHKLYVFSLATIVIVTFSGLIYYGADYYKTDMEERHFHIQYDLLKPTGIIGHGIGIAGSFFIVAGVFGYMARKRIRRFSMIGKLKYWLEFHIFLTTLGPVLVLFHTTLKFGGIVAVSFWSMVAVIISGITGRFFYLQIPRTIEGKELDVKELKTRENELYLNLINRYKINPSHLKPLNNHFPINEDVKRKGFLQTIITRFLYERRLLKQIKKELKAQNIPSHEYKSIVRIYRTKMVLSRRIAWLSSMQKYLHYWHVVHLPFALVMLVIMVIHIAVALMFGYKWIF